MHRRLPGAIAVVVVIMAIALAALAEVTPSTAGGGLKESVADTLYLKLDASNDPLTSGLQVSPGTNGSRLRVDDNSNNCRMEWATSSACGQSAHFYVADNAGSSNIRITDGGDWTLTAADLGTLTAPNGITATSSAGDITLNPGGNVSIGTSTVTWPSGSAVLDMDPSSGAAVSASSGSLVLTTGDAGGQVQITPLFSHAYLQSAAGSDFYIRRGTANRLILGTNAVQVDSVDLRLNTGRSLVFQSDANSSIGASGTEALVVWTQSIDDSDGEVAVDAALDVNGSYITVGDGASAATIGSSGAYDLQLRTNGADRVVIDAAGADTTFSTDVIAGSGYYLKGRRAVAQISQNEANAAITLTTSALTSGATLISFNNDDGVDGSGLVTEDAANEQIDVLAGTYRLHVDCGADGTTGSTTAQFQWYDTTATANVGARFDVALSTTLASFSFDRIVTTASTTSYELHARAGSSYDVDLWCVASAEQI